MADNGSGQKTEQPTPRRKQKAREEGQVARSQELNSAFSLLASFLVLFIIFQRLFAMLQYKMVSLLSFTSLPVVNKESSFNLIMESFYDIARIVAPVMLAAAIVGGVTSFLQVGAMFNTKVIMPRLSKINPISGLKRLFSLKSIVELLKALSKAIIVGILTYNQLKHAWPTLITMTEQGLEPSLLFIGKLIFRIGINVIIFLLVLGIADYFYQRYEHNKSLKMTKQEVKQEHKDIEGDPQIRSKRRQKQMQMSMNRMIKALEEADVVITNPTHIAIAIKYDLENMEAPLVVAKGEDYLALKIKEKAAEFKIEIVENKPLARALNASTEIGQEIPVDLYQAVAEVLAFVYKNNKKL